jgi:hypothetical protein
MEQWCSDCKGSTFCLDPSSSMLRSPPNWLTSTSQKIGTKLLIKFDEILPFATSMIKPKIPSTNEASYLHNDSHEKVKNFEKPRVQWKVAKWLCKICECVKIWLSLDICVKYGQWVKIWPFKWKFDFHWIFVWNMLNVWKYNHLSEIWVS